MKTEEIYSWGNNFHKEVEYDLNLSKSNGVCIGNQNSYGDCFFPHSNYSYKVLNEKKPKPGLVLNPSTTIGNFINLNNRLLFGIPGKENVTIAGAIASDTHGKDNTWGGSFSKNIDSFKLRLANKDLINCSYKENREAFTATIGGYGLTGIIEEVTFKENTIPFSFLFNKKIEKGSGFYELLNNFSDTKFQYWVGWVNLLNKNFDWVVEKSGAINTKQKKDIIYPKSSIGRIALPFIGKNILNSMSFINYMYFHLNSNNKSKIVDLQKAIFPLSLISDTRNISPNRRILQIQFSIPLKNELHIEELIEILIYNQTPLLCSIKRLDKSLYENNLSFYQEGWTVAVDFSEKYFNLKSYEAFLKKLINLEGKIYLAKDSLLSEKHFKEMYTNFSEWEETLKKLDPQNKFQSMMSNRLGLKKW